MRARFYPPGFCKVYSNTLEINFDPPRKLITLKISKHSSWGWRDKQLMFKTDKNTDYCKLWIYSQSIFPLIDCMHLSSQARPALGSSVCKRLMAACNIAERRLHNSLARRSGMCRLQLSLLPITKSCGIDFFIFTLPLIPRPSPPPTFYGFPVGVKGMETLPVIFLQPTGAGRDGEASPPPPAQPTQRRFAQDELQ